MPASTSMVACPCTGWLTGRHRSRCSSKARKAPASPTSTAIPMQTSALATRAPCSVTHRPPSPTPSASRQPAAIRRCCRARTPSGSRPNSRAASALTTGRLRPRQPTPIAMPCAGPVRSPAGTGSWSLTVATTVPLARRWFASSRVAPYRAPGSWAASTTSRARRSWWNSTTSPPSRPPCARTRSQPSSPSPRSPISAWSCQIQASTRPCVA